MKRRFDDSCIEQEDNSVDAISELVEAVKKLNTEAKLLKEEKRRARDRKQRDEVCVNVEKELKQVRNEKMFVNQRRVELKNTVMQSGLPSDEYDKLGTRLQDLHDMEMQLTMQQQENSNLREREVSKMTCLQSLQRSLGDLESRIQQTCSQEESLRVNKKRRIRAHSTERVWAWLQSTANAINIAPPTTTNNGNIRILREAQAALLEGNQQLSQYYCTDHESVESCWSIDPEPVMSDSAVQVQ